MGEVARSTTPEVNVPPSVAERKEAGVGGQGRPAGLKGRSSQQGPEEAEAQWEHQHQWQGPGIPRGGGRRVAETPGAALPDDLPEHPAGRRPLIDHVGVRAPGGAALAEQNIHP